MLTPGVEFSIFLFIDGFLALLTGIIVFSRDKTYALNRMVLLALTFFTIFFVAEGFIYIIAPNDPDLVVSNLLRDISMFSAGIASVILLTASLYLNRGPTYLKNRSLGIFIWLITIVGMFIGIQFDHITISSDKLVVENQIIAVLTLFLIPGFFVVISLEEFYYLAKSVDSQQLKRQIRLVSFGLVFILVGILYYAIVEVLGLRKGVLFYIGHIFYFIADLLILYWFLKTTTN